MKVLILTKDFDKPILELAYSTQENSDAIRRAVTKINTINPERTDTLRMALSKVMNDDKVVLISNPTFPYQQLRARSPHLRVLHAYKVTPKRVKQLFAYVNKNPMYEDALEYLNNRYMLHQQDCVNRPLASLELHDYSLSDYLKEFSSPFDTPALTTLEFIWCVMRDRNVTRWSETEYRADTRSLYHVIKLINNITKLEEFEEDADS